MTPVFGIAKVSYKTKEWDLRYFVECALDTLFVYLLMKQNKLKLEIIKSERNRDLDPAYINATLGNDSAKDLVRI